VHRNIQENAELLSEEGKLLRTVQQQSATQEDIDNYIDTLEKVLDRKEEMILTLQEKLLVFSEYLEKENELSKKVGSLPQY
jgi:chromosome segregation ATPase